MYRLLLFVIITCQTRDPLSDLDQFPSLTKVQFEVSKESLETMLVDMRRIKLQLDKIASKAAAAAPSTDAYSSQER